MFDTTLSMSESVIHHDFAEATLCSFCKITESHRDFDISNIKLKIFFIFLINE